MSAEGLNSREGTDRRGVPRSGEPASRIPALLLLTLIAAPAADLPPQRILERYKGMLAASPVEGTVLDRLWKAYAEAGETGRLIAEYEASPTFPRQMILGALQQKAGLPDRAGEAFARAAQLEPQNPLPWIAVGQLLAELGRHAEAAAAYESATKLLESNDPRRTDLLVRLGVEWLAAGAREKAIAAWEQTVAIDPHNLSLRRRLADTYVKNGLPDAAVPHLEFLGANGPVAEQARVLADLARLYQGAGRIDEAIETLERAIARTAPGNWLRADLQDRIIRLCERVHRIAELEVRWEKEAADNPRDLGSALQLVELYERQGETEKELAWLEKAAALAPKESSHRIKLARLLVQVDQWERAAPLYDKLLVEQPANADLLFELATLDIRRGAPAQARERIEGFLSKNADDEPSRTRALAFFERNRFTDLVEKQRLKDAQKGNDDAIVALAEFYFSANRGEEAERQLGRLIRAGDPVEKRARGWLRMAQVLKGRNLLLQAIAAAESGAALVPDPGNAPISEAPAPPEQGRGAVRSTAREIRMLLGEMQGMAGNHDASAAAYEAAAGLGASEGEIADADQKRFEALRQAGETGAETPPTQSRGRVAMTLPPPPGKVVAAPTPKVAKAIEDLTLVAGVTFSPAAWLRASRWHLWGHDTPGAIECVRKALQLDPHSIPAHTLLVTLTGSGTGIPAALDSLKTLAELDPSNRLDYERQVIRIRAQTGLKDEPVAALKRLVAANPGNFALLGELGQAQERAEQWKDALETWKQAYAAAQKNGKREALGSLLRTYSHLKQPVPAAELLLGALDATEDGREQAELFQELLAHCTSHGLLPWLRTRWEERRKRLIDDDFTELAYGRLLEAAGERRAAFEVLSNAALAAAKPGDILPELVQVAEDRRRLDLAVDLQARLVRFSTENSSEALERLAGLQEKAFRSEDAAKTWEKIASRFPRDAAALLQAAEFHLRSGNPAASAALLHRVRAFEPENLQALFALATLDPENRTRAEAEDCLERVLTLTTPLDAGKGIRFPGMRNENPNHLQTAYLTAVRQRGGQATADGMRALRGFWVDSPISGKEEGSLRLEAVRELGRSVRAGGDKAALEKWIARWKQAAEKQPSEALWALFHADAGEAVLEVLDSMLAKEPENPQLEQAFIWLGLQTRQMRRLGEWMRNPARTTIERDFLVVGLGEYLDAHGGSVDPGLVDELFPPGARARLWQVAELFGGRGHFDAASKLGDRAFEQPDQQRLLMGMELARWHLALGRTNEARRVMTRIAGAKAATFDSPVYEAIRESWLLLPEEERECFAQRVEQDLDPGKEPVAEVLTRVLLRGLAGREAEARRALHSLLRMRAMEEPPAAEKTAPALRFWNFVLTTGIHLEAWKLHSLASALWEEALADPALVRLDGEPAQEVAREARTRLFALKIAGADKDSVGALLREYGASGQPDGALALGEALEALGAGVRAAEVYRILWERDRSNPQILRNLLAAARNFGDQELAEDVLRSCVANHLFEANESLAREIVVQLADLLERRGAREEAIDTLRRANARSGPDPRLLVALAEREERFGLLPAAEATWRELISLDSGHTFARVALATLLQRQGKFQAALEALGKVSGSEAFGKQAELLFQSGHPDDAFAAIERIPAGNQANPVQEFAKLMIRAGAISSARELLRDAMNRTTDPATLMQMQELVLEACSKDRSRVQMLRELYKLRRFAEGDPARVGSYFAYVEVHAAEFGVEEPAVKEMKAAWAGGEGEFSAGAVLVAWQVDHHDPEAGAVLTGLLGRSDASEQWLRVVDASLRAAGRLDLAARTAQRITELIPGDDERAALWIRTLSELGRKEEAVAALEKWAARAPLNDEFAGKVAQLCIELGLHEKAASLLAQAVRGDPFGRNYQARLDLAKLRVSEGRLVEARKLLLEAFRNPQNHAWDDLAAYLAAAQPPDRFDAELAAFHLSQKQMAAVKTALSALLGRGPAEQLTARPPVKD